MKITKHPSIAASAGTLVIDKDEVVDGGAIGTIKTIIAGENIAKWDALYIHKVGGGRTNGQAYRADNDDTGNQAYPVVGIATEAVTAGNEVRYLESGYAKDSGWAYTAGNKIWLGSTPGALVTSLPTSANYQQDFGEALASDFLSIYVSDELDTDAISLSNMPAAASDDIDASTQKIINVVDPALAQDAATKASSEAAAASAASSAVSIHESDTTNVHGFTDTAQVVGNLKNNATPTPAAMTAIDVDGTLTGDSDTALATQKAVKTYADTKEPLLSKSNLTASAPVAVSNTPQIIGASAANIDLKNNATPTPAAIDEIDVDGTLAADSDVKLATQKAVKTYADTKEPALTKGNLTANSPLSFDQTRDVIGGAAALSIQDATTSQKGAVQLQDSIDTATDKAITPNAVKGHEDSTTAHGATGANVGTTNTQTLTNKTLQSTKQVLRLSDLTGDGQYFMNNGYLLQTNETAIAVGDVVGIDSSGYIVKANAATGSVQRALGVAATSTTGTGTEDITVIVDGAIYKTTWAAGMSTTGARQYVGETAGQLTETAPSDTGDMIQEVGTNMDGNKLLVKVTGDATV